MNLAELRSFLGKLSQEDIIFDPHFYKRTGDRPISEGMARSFLGKPHKISHVEEGRKGRIKVWITMSRRYFLVLIIEISKGLKVISAWNSDKKWQNKLKR